MIKKMFLALTVLMVLSVQSQPLEKSLLWKISGNGLEKPSFLFGTIHMSCDATISPLVQKAMDDTAQLYLELDMDEPGLQMGLIQGMMMTDGKTVSSYLSAEDRALVDSFLKEKAGAGLDMLDTMKPIMLSMMTLPSLLSCPVKSVEQELMKISSAQSEELFGLESVQDQLDALNAVPVEEQVSELLKSVKGNLEKDKQELMQLMAVYQVQDIELMLRLSEESENVTTSKYGADLLDNRNKKWIPKIASVAKEKPTMFAVGAAHLAGENGVIRLLRKQGFTVEAVR